MASGDEEETVADRIARFSNLRTEVKKRKPGLLDLQETNSTFKLMNLVSRSSEILDRVTHPQECRAESAVFTDLSEIAATRSEKLFKEVTPSDIICKLKKAFDNDSEIFDWDKLGGIFPGNIPAHIGISHMLGTLAPVLTVRHAQRVKRETVVRPIQKAKLLGSCQEAGEMPNERKEYMYGELKKLKSVPFIETVLDANSFIRTVQNVLALSELLSTTKRVTMVVNDSEDGAVIKINKRDQKNGMKNEIQSAKRALIVPMSMEIWQKMKEAAKEQDCLMRSFRTEDTIATHSEPAIIRNNNMRNANSGENENRPATLENGRNQLASDLSNTPNKLKRKSEILRGKQPIEYSEPTVDFAPPPKRHMSGRYADEGPSRPYHQTVQDEGPAKRQRQTPQGRPADKSPPGSQPKTPQGRPADKGPSGSQPKTPNGRPADRSPFGSQPKTPNGPVRGSLLRTARHRIPQGRPEADGPSKKQQQQNPQGGLSHLTNQSRSPEHRPKRQKTMTPQKDTNRVNSEAGPPLHPTGTLHSNANSNLNSNLKSNLNSNKSVGSERMGLGTPRSSSKTSKQPTLVQLWSRTQSGHKKEAARKLPENEGTSKEAARKLERRLFEGENGNKEKKVQEPDIIDLTQDDDNDNDNGNAAGRRNNDDSFSNAIDLTVDLREWVERRRINRTAAHVKTEEDVIDLT